MGEIAESMINGESCEWCGCYLEPGEKVYQPMYAETDSNEITEYEQYTMPEDGDGMGFPVVCGSCAEWTED